MERKKFLFFRWKAPVIVNSQAVHRILSGIENSVYSGTSNVEDLLLLSFLKPAGLLNRIFHERKQRKNARSRLNKILKYNQSSIAVADALSATNVVITSIRSLQTARAAVSSV